MAMNLSMNEQNSVTGLGTWTLTAAAAGGFNASIRSIVLPPSGLNIEIEHNSTSVITTVIPGPSANTISLSTNIYCAAGDTISFILTSGAAEDQIPNSVQSSIVCTSI